MIVSKRCVTMNHLNLLNNFQFVRISQDLDLSSFQDIGKNCKKNEVKKIHINLGSNTRNINRIKRASWNDTLQRN